ncbi:MAG TPA: tetratricopeptide repeat protein, partial [Acidimicrobiia bacterium]
GDPAVQLIDVLAGSLVDHLAAAEQLAQAGHVVVDESALASLRDRVRVSEVRVDADSGRTVGVVDDLLESVPPGELPRVLEPIPDEVARSWLIPTVYERLEAGGGAFFAELRPAYPMFVRFGGINYDEDPDAVSKLDVFIRQVQAVLTRYDGTLMQLTLGDKGAYLFAALGSPRAHEDDAERAIRAASEIVELEHSTAVDGIRAGVATGRVFSGTYGHSMRRTFTCLGDPVNLAARLMGLAGSGEVLVLDRVADTGGDRFEWEERNGLSLKGKVETVDARRLKGLRTGEVRRHLRYPLPMVGRERELELIEERLERAIRGERSIVGISADPGLGKSRLVAEVLRRLNAADRRVAYGEAQAFGRNTSYLIWRTPWRTLLGLETLPPAAHLSRVLESLAELGPEYVQRAPLLSNVVGVEIPDNEVTASFDAKLRKASLESLLVDMLRASLEGDPLVVVLEDSHWIDEASLDLLEVLVRGTSGLPVLFLIAYRSEIDAEVRDRIAALAAFEEVQLQELTPEAVERVILAKLEQQFGSEVLPSRPVVQLIVERGQGNPFYIEELVNFLSRGGVDITDPGAVVGLDLPDSLQALVLGRIDGLEEMHRATLKVASVIGREFDLPALPGVYPDLGDRDLVASRLAGLRQADLVTPDRVGDDSWLFKHAITRDVAYDSMPYALRSTLHETAGGYFERSESGTVDLNLDLLAHHYWLSGNTEKKVEYQRRAGEAAKASYSNAAAIEYFERLASVVEADERVDALLKLGEVRELVGDWPQAEAVAAEALDLATGSGNRLQVGWCEVALAEAARKQGRFEEASERLVGALTAFDTAGDAAGKARVHHLMGTVAAQHGKLEEARTAYEAGLEIREGLGDRLGMAALLSNLGIVAEYGGELPTSRNFHERALSLRTELGDRWAIANSRTNLGMISVLQKSFSEARDHFEVAMRLNREVGDAYMVALSHNNLGNAFRELGEHSSACRQYIASADAYLGFGDRWGLAFLLEDVALLAMALGEVNEALVLLGAAGRMRDDINVPRNEALAAELAERIETASGLADPARSKLLSEGRSLDTEPATVRAVALCSSWALAASGP